ncbi:hypothetical protein ZOSMA_99G00230 [Zostera marina]|uniref:Uncharacterized protein n=1 Tax=Zostera marina TaxID=29655 RepID=A0A0K9NHJ2_ZOSMR|nr:hypothetical protein ZOSMA_99G00230 [Zostera marina]
MSFTYGLTYRMVSRKIALSPKTLVIISDFEGDNMNNRSTYLDWYKGQTFIQLLVQIFKPKRLPDKPSCLYLQLVYGIEVMRIMTSGLKSISSTCGSFAFQIGVGDKVEFSVEKREEFSKSDFSIKFPNFSDNYRKLRQLKDLDVMVSFIHITKRSKMTSFYNTRSTTISLIEDVKGKILFTV